MPDATVELERASADIPLTRSARDILDRAAAAAKARGASASPNDVLQAILSSRGSFAYEAISALGIDPPTIVAQLPGADVAQPIPIRQLLVNANREAQVLGHYQVDSIHLLLAMLYSDSPETSAPLQKAGLTLYDLRRHLQTGTKADFQPGESDRARRIDQRGQSFDRRSRGFEIDQLVVQPQTVMPRFVLVQGRGQRFLDAGADQADQQFVVVHQVCPGELVRQNVLTSTFYCMRVFPEFLNLLRWVAGLRGTACRRDRGVSRTRRFYGAGQALPMSSGLKGC